jgi:AraC-like DNA-binding protein
MTIQREQVRIPASMLQMVEPLSKGAPDGQGLSDVLDRVGVSEAQYRDPSFHFNGEQLLGLLRQVDWQGIPGNPVARVLDAFSWSGTGLLALAGMSSATVHDAMEVAVAFHHLALPVIRLDARNRAAETIMTVELNTDLEEMGPMMVELALFGLKRIADETAGKLPVADVRLAHPHWFGADEQDAADSYLHHFGCRVTFNSDFTGLVAGPEFWEKPLRNANNATRRMALDMLQVADNRAGQEQTFGGRVSALMEQAAEDGLYLKLDELAEKMNVTPRTLNRRLAREGMKFSDLVSDLRLSKAKELLRNTDWSIKRIAHLTGYRDSASFTRAFKQHSGRTPKQWREEQSV